MIGDEECKSVVSSGGTSSAQGLLRNPRRLVPKSGAFSAQAGVEERSKEPKFLDSTLLGL